MRKKWITLSVLIVLCITFSLLYPKQNVFKRAIVVGIGIDVNLDELEVTIEYMKEQKYIVHSTKSNSIENAFEKITKEIGLKVSISQCNAIILQKNQSIYAIFEELTKLTNISTNTSVISCSGAKEFLNSEIEVQDSVSNLISDIMLKKDNKIVLKDILIAYKTKRPIEIIGLDIKNKSLIEIDPLKLDFN